MATVQYDYGMIGLGTMGRNLVYNMCDHGYSVTGFDKDGAQVTAFQNGAGSGKVFGTASIGDFITALKRPRIILLLVPAGAAVDAVISELKPLLSKQDILIDCGNSHFTDTDKRIELLAKENLHFMGVGISGGEEGARYGPSIMPGGNREIYSHVGPMLEAISAKVNNEPCVTYLGSGSSGHYVKMVHNGIEYGLMQLISEAYYILKHFGGLTNDELHEVFSKWNEGPLQSFLIEITAEIFLQKDDLSDNRLIDMIADSARQKGTGKWTSQSAMDLQAPVPSIDIAVTAREISSLSEERQAAQKKLKGPVESLSIAKEDLIKLLEDTLHFSMITTYAQGMDLLQHASAELKYDLKLEEVARIWRGGCIIRARLLENIRAAFSKQPALANLMLDDYFAKTLAQMQAGIRKVIQIAAAFGAPAPVMMASLSYYDSYRCARLPTNLIQAQRDYFGAHTYERIDRKGVFHTHWAQNEKTKWNQ
jgi:6-phosphogluconate dehydrogenase